MIKKSILLVMTTMLVAIIILIGLVTIAPLPNKENNGFKRKWLTEPQILKQNETNIPIESLCGASEGYLFFSTHTPRWLIRSNYNLDKIDTIFFPVTVSQTVLQNNHFDICGSFAYLFINNQPGYIYGKLNDSSISAPTFIQTKQIFSQSTSISAETAVIRTFDSLQKRQIFQKISGPSGQITAEEPIFDIQPDRGFGSDGMLKFDNKLKFVVYIQFYQNRFFVLDTNLKVRNQFNTIDTISTNEVQITEAKIAGEEKLVPAKARIIVNKKAFVDNGILYVVSGLRADNETHKTFRHHSTIDSYLLDNGKYLGSFHIPNQESKKMNSFIVEGNKLVAFYQKNIVVYQVHTPSHSQLSTLKSSN